MNAPQFLDTDFIQMLSRLISEYIGAPFEVNDYIELSGGDINDAYCVSGRSNLPDNTPDIRFFVKTNHIEQLAMFKAEALALNQLANISQIKIPKVIYNGLCGNRSTLVLEYFDIEKMDSNDAFAFGQELARLHLYDSENAYGFELDNFIGITPQQNDWNDDWANFFADQRIAPQLALANKEHLLFNDAESIISRCRSLLAQHKPKPSLLHGDLWSGNVALSTEGPLMFDPASYWGDRECDLAMTELFGGFPPDFYRGYDSVFPLTEGYQDRKKIYNLYHILNHTNIFGGEYYSQAKKLIQELHW